ncbi:MAG TPA: type II toxin-antitoxin system VapC family toxin [Verrucomicrobiales bacterium]|nr:type II toxin-antitoxin system VapC family toxin [Verrucomicrobiales bacterium]
MQALLDTNILSELARPKPNSRVVDYLSQGIQGYVSVITLHELRHGTELVKNLKKRKRLLEWIDSIHSEYQSSILPVTTDVAARAAIMRASASRKGLTLHIEDALIAATASLAVLTLATRNTNDFEITGIKLFNPWDA